MDRRPGEGREGGEESAEDARASEDGWREREAGGAVCG